MTIARTIKAILAQDLMDLIKMIVKVKEVPTTVVPLVLLVCCISQHFEFLFVNSCLIVIDGGGNDYRRSGLGSDDRKPSYGQSYGGNTEEYSVPNHMVGLLIGKGGENLKKIERMSGVSKVQFSNGNSE